MSQVVSDVFFSILFAALLFLVFEVPALTIEKILLRGGKLSHFFIIQQVSISKITFEHRQGKGFQTFTLMQASGL
jgi:hypothetical protein